jgi:hypothetical protein
MELNKNTLSSANRPSSPNSLSVGPTTDTQALRDPTIAPSVPTFPSVAQFQTLTTKLVSTLESKFQALMLRSCQDSGNTKLDQSMEFLSEINSGYLVGYLAVLQRTTT